MNVGRRLLLGSGLALGALLALPRALLAAVWPEKAFTARDLDTALQALFGAQPIQASSAITLKAPEIAENGAVVPISISTTLENVESISLFVEKNPSPLVASMVIPPGTVPDISTRIKMGQTSNVMAVVKSEGALFSAGKEVKVTIGGCGG